MFPGPLEATINNLSRELVKKDVEGKDLQRHWINLQTELVAKQNANSELSESHARLTSNFSILYQKKVSLEQELDQEHKQVCCCFQHGPASSLDGPTAAGQGAAGFLRETRPEALSTPFCGMQMKDIERQLSRLNQDMIRLNTLISKNQELGASLENETFNLQRNVVCELKELEGKAASLEHDIDTAAQSKKRALSDVLETERQIMLWERKNQLEKEMQEILDPSVGQV